MCLVPIILEFIEEFDAKIKPNHWRKRWTVTPCSELLFMDALAEIPVGPQLVVLLVPSTRWFGSSGRNSTKDETIGSYGF